MEDQIITTKLVNALYEESGGMWIGGKATVTKTHIDFKMNAFNKLVNNCVQSFTISITDIKQLNLIRGLLTNIISISTAKSTYKIRCYGAEKVIESINVLREHAN